MNLFLQPADVLFFRDGSPFAAGEDHIAHLTFPPSPSTIYGGLRSLLLERHMGCFSEFPGKTPDSLRPVVGDDRILGSLEVTDFGIATKEGKNFKRLFPIPRNLARNKESGEIVQLNPLEIAEGVHMNLPGDFSQVLGPGALGLEELSGFLTANGMRDCIANKIPEEADIVDPKEVYDREPRIGLGRNPGTLTAEEGMLYSADFARFNSRYNVSGHHSAGFMVSTINDGGTFTSSAKRDVRMMRIGGESKLVFLEYDVHRESLPLPNEEQKFKVILLTPVVFTNGWLPDGIDPTTLEGKILECEASLVVAAVGAATMVGGWDIRGGVKPSHRAVPAGSVYFFKAKGSQGPLSLKQQPVNISSDKNHVKQGFGLSIIGGW